MLNVELLETRIVPTVPSWAQGFTNPSIPAADGTDISFVNRTYGLILHRLPEAAGLANWLVQLQNYSRAQVAEAIFTSPESLQNANGRIDLDVESYYNYVLDRQSDAIGLAAWTQVVNATAPVKGDFYAEDFLLIGGFFGSLEFYGAPVPLSIQQVAGPQGPKGDTGPAGPQGPSGKDGTTPDLTAINAEISSLEAEITVLQNTINDLKNATNGDTQEITNLANQIVIINQEIVTINNEITVLQHQTDNDTPPPANNGGNGGDGGAGGQENGNGGQGGNGGAGHDNGGGNNNQNNGQGNQNDNGNGNHNGQN